MVAFFAQVQRRWIPPDNLVRSLLRDDQARPYRKLGLAIVIHGTLNDARRAEFRASLSGLRFPPGIARWIQRLIQRTQPVVLRKRLVAHRWHHQQIASPSGGNVSYTNALRTLANRLIRF